MGSLKCHNKESKVLYQCSSPLILSETKFRKPLFYQCFDFSQMTCCFPQWCFKHSVGCVLPVSNLVRKTEVRKDRGARSREGQWPLPGWIASEDARHGLPHTPNLPDDTFISPLAGKNLRGLLCIKALTFQIRKLKQLRPEWATDCPKPWKYMFLEKEITFGLLWSSFISNPKENHFSHALHQVITQPLLEHLWWGRHGFSCPFHSQMCVILVSPFSIIRGHLLSCCIHGQLLPKLPEQNLETSVSQGSYSPHGSLYWLDC